MTIHEPQEHHILTRREAIFFYGKSRLLIAFRFLKEWRNAPLRHRAEQISEKSQILSRATSPLWTQISPEEFPLTAGKVQNLRIASRALRGVMIPAGETFSFWKQLGRVTKRAGYVIGRELRSGCVVPNRGGGLCQLSGLLYEAALKAGLEIVEQHAHSRSVSGVPLVPERDATVFWNYVDLRFRADFDWQIDVNMSATELEIQIRAFDTSVHIDTNPSPAPLGQPQRARADGDCLTCGMVACFRHPSAKSAHPASQGITAWLLEAHWPEFNQWLSQHAQEGDQWMIPMDGHRWGRANYEWQLPLLTRPSTATLLVFWRAWRQRSIQPQGAVRQKFLLESQRLLAKNYARKLSEEVRHIVVSQPFLPYLWREGHLSGRTFDVLMTRLPISHLHAQLDNAARRYPQASTLVDFRAEGDLARDENDALAAAARLVTPHQELAKTLGSRAILLDWALPQTSPLGEVARETTQVKWFFPASALARKGIYEMTEAVTSVGGELWVLGRASEGAASVPRGVPIVLAKLVDMRHCKAVVLPAWVEHEPRVLLRALAQGIPVIASRACGLAPHPHLHEIEAGDVTALIAVMRACLSGSNKASVGAGEAISSMRKT